MRAYRPGRVGSDEFNKEFQGQRLEKIDLYVLRAMNGLPLFGTPTSLDSLPKAAPQPTDSAELL